MMGIGQTLYGRAPATVLTLASLVLSFLATRAREDYRLYCALGTGGLGKPCILSWLVHTLALRPLAIGREAAEDPDFVPLDDEEWAKRVAETRAGADREKGSHPLHARRPSMDLAALPPRNGDRPFAFGIIPHRQLTDVAPGGGDVQEAIIAHLESLAQRFPLALSLALSSYEASTSPCLFVRHLPEDCVSGQSGLLGRDVAGGVGDTGFAHPTTLARMYLAGTPAPKYAITTGRGSSSPPHPLPRDDTKHELAHIHLSEGSLHLALAPQDARRVIEQGWGELHRLAGMAYRGVHLPPYWLPPWLGNTRERRWGYQRRQLDQFHDLRRRERPRGQGKNDRSLPFTAPTGRLVPPTYLMVYAPQSESQLAQVKHIIDCSVAWATGRPF